MKAVHFPTHIDSDLQDIAATLVPDYLRYIGASKDVELGSGVLKSTAFLAPASPPTLVHPVIETPFDTLIAPVELLRHSAGAKSQHQQDEGIGTDLFPALHDYEVKDLPKVEDYLRHNNDLLEFLRNFSDRSLRLVGVDSLALEFYHDIEEHWQKLYVTVRTRMVDMDQLDELEDELYSSFFEPQAIMLSGRVVLSTG